MSDLQNIENGVALGVDGGAGALKFALQKGAENPRYYECKGASPTLLGMDEFVSRLSQGIHDALASAGVTPDQVTSAGFGLSGVDRENEINHLKQKLSIVLPNAKGIWIGNDALPALRLGAGKLQGLVMIAGTGSICFGVAADGHMLRVGGWGGELGDEGSGFWIGVRGLQAAVRMADGRLPKTEMLAKVLEKVGVKNPEELIPWSSGLSRAEFKTQAASLFPIVASQAAEGDPTAKQAILLGIGHLIQHALAAASRLDKYEKREMMEADTMTVEPDITQVEGDDGIGRPARRFELVCSGGLFVNNRDFYDTFVFQLKRKKDIFSPIRLTDSPALGAILLGIEAAEQKEASLATNS